MTNPFAVSKMAEHGLLLSLAECMRVTHLGTECFLHADTLNFLEADGTHTSEQVRAVILVVSQINTRECGELSSPASIIARL